MEAYPAAIGVLTGHLLTEERWGVLCDLCLDLPCSSSQDDQDKGDSLMSCRIENFQSTRLKTHDICTYSENYIRLTRCMFDFGSGVGQDARSVPLRWLHPSQVSGPCAILCAT
jgi:hypothetical protein